MRQITVERADFDQIAATNPTWPMVWISMSGGADRLAVIGNASTMYQLWLIGGAAVASWSEQYDARASQVQGRDAAVATLALSNRQSVAFPEYTGAPTIDSVHTQASGAPSSVNTMTLLMTSTAHVQGGELILSAPAEGDMVSIEVVDGDGNVLHTLANALTWPWWDATWTLKRKFPSVAEVQQGHGVRFTLTRGPGAVATCEMIAHVDTYS